MIAFQNMLLTAWTVSFVFVFHLNNRFEIMLWLPPLIKLCFNQKWLLKMYIYLICDISDIIWNVFICCALVLFVFCAVLCVCFCTGHFVIVPLNLTRLHCLQHSFLEHHFNLYYIVLLCLWYLRKHYSWFLMVFIREYV